MLRRSSYMSNKMRQSLLSLSVFLCSTVSVTAQELQTLPILEKAKALQCSLTEGSAKVALGNFWEIQEGIGNFPDEHLLKGQTQTVHAATLDIVLNTLVSTANRYPSLRSQVERTMLQWNYCDVIESGVLFDLESDGNSVSRVRAPKMSPIDWQGFKSLGFFGEVEGRFVPDLISLDQNSLRVDFEWLFHRIYREQCFPHPDTSELFDRFDGEVNQKLASIPNADPEAVYPYVWDPECIYPVAVPTLETQVAVEPLREVADLKTEVEIVVVKLDVPELKPSVVISSVPQEVPQLKTSVLISPTEIAVPPLQTKLVITPIEAAVPVLSTRLVIDRPKPKVKPKAKVSANNGFGGYSPHTHGSGRGVGFGGAGTPGHTHTVSKKVVTARPVQQVRTVAVVEPAKTIIVDKNQPLLERLLGGLSAGNNILIVDNLQLTVNEYNGSVETVISGSDIGSVDSVLPAKNTTTGVKHFVKSQFVPTVKSSPVIPEVTKKAAIKTVQRKVSDVLVTVPKLNSRVLVTKKPLPKPVVIKKQVRGAVGRASEKAKTKVAVKKPVVKRYQQYSRKPKVKEKTVEELLQAYAEFEAAKKKKQYSKKKELKTEALESYKPKLSKASTVNKTKSVPKETPLAVNKDLKNTTKKVDYTFFDYGLSTADPTQASPPAMNIPVGLGLDAPVPYIINETFRSDIDNGSKGKVSDKEKKLIGLAGNVYLKKSLANSKWAIGGSVNRKLIKDSYWFARAGWNYSLEDESDPFSYSWGIGYSDWHPGTFSAQLNNWGPLKLGDGLALDKAVASFGYSVKSEILKKYRLSVSGALNVPIDGNSSAAANFRWSPKENWYINSSLSYPLEGGGEPKWSYGFGYSDWRPNKFNLQYSNYGPNDLFEPNYKKNGTWSFSYNWKF